MMARVFSVLALAVALTNAGPVIRRQSSAPATVNFTPYAAPGCQMSENPHSTLKTTSWNVTTGSGCITSSYAFSSYVEEANADALGPCSLSLYTGPECTGDVTAATRTSYEDCIPDITSAQSFLLACGP